MVGKAGRKKTIWFGLIISLLFLSILTSFVGEVKEVQAVGGAYSITLRAANPATYIPPIPYPETVPPLWGRQDGSLAIPGADWQGNPSLEPSEMALCQIAPFFFEIDVLGDTQPENGSIILTAEWATITTSGVDFGFDEDYMIYGAFIDTSDPDTIDPLGNANVTMLSELPIYNNKNIISAFEGTFQVDGLESGDTVILEVWVVLECYAPPGVNGNLHVSLTDAWTNTTPTDAISTGNQTIPLLQVGELESVDVALSVNKVDDGIPAALDMSGWTQPWPTTVTVTASLLDPVDSNYVANGVVITDTLDPWVELLSDQDYDPTLNPYGVIFSAGVGSCNWVDDDTDGLGGTLTCDLGAVAEGSSISVTYYTRAKAGVPIGSVCEGSSETDPATSLATECPPTYLSFSGYDVSNTVTMTTIADDITLDDNWDAEAKDIQYPTAVTIESFEAETVKFKDVLLKWTASDWDEYLDGFNVYMAASEDGDKIKLNDALILPEEGEFTFDGFEFEFMVKGSQVRWLPFHTYYFWLEDVNMGGNNLTGPIDVTITPPGRMK